MGMGRVSVVATRTGFNLVRGGESFPLLDALSISDASRDFAWPER